MRGNGAHVSLQWIGSGRTAFNLQACAWGMSGRCLHANQINLAAEEFAACALQAVARFPASCQQPGLHRSSSGHPVLRAPHIKFLKKNIFPKHVVKNVTQDDVTQTSGTGITKDAAILKSPLLLYSATALLQIKLFNPPDLLSLPQSIFVRHAFCRDWRLRSHLLLAGESHPRM